MNVTRLVRIFVPTAAGRLLLVAVLGAGLPLACSTNPTETPEPDETGEDIQVDTSKPDIKKDTGGGVGWDVPIVDVGDKPDAGKPPKPDAGKVDANLEDGGATDSGDPDGGSADAGDPGDGAGDGGVPDGGEADAGAISCAAGAKVCDGNKAVVCNATGDGYVAGGSDCSPGVCQAGACKADQICVAGAESCAGKVAWKCDADGKDKTELMQCGKTSVCKLVDFDGEKTAECVPQICVPSKMTCAGKYDPVKHAFDSDVLVKCNSDGTIKKSTGTDCAAAGKLCVVDSAGVAECKDPACGDGKVSKDSGEQCDLGSDAATGAAKNGVDGAKCTKACKLVDDGCSSNADCAKLTLGACDLAWTCNPKYKVCEPVAKLSGVCDDGNPCTTDDSCIVGTCFGFDAPCDDNNACTQDGCDPKTGCTNNALLNVACDDGQDCTVGDVCSGGSCKSGKNACQCTVDADCTKFNDGDPCTGTLTCKSGACVVKEGTAITCGDGVCISKEKALVACEKAGKKWIAGTGKCHDPLSKSATKDEAACKAASGTWHAASACRLATCAANVGACLLKLAINGSVCSDGDACTKSDQCWGGLCEGDPAACDDKNPCTSDACHPINGCVFVAATGTGGDPKPCDDGDKCTNVGGLDECANGQCVGVNGCECAKDADCAGKSGDDLCVGSHKCDPVAKKCVIDPATVVWCDPKLSSGCSSWSCDPKVGQCKTTYAKAGAKCDDGDACTTDDACTAGVDKVVCSGKKNTCEDGNFCTTDSCDSKFGCSNFANANLCDDGNPCTSKDHCVDGKCWPGSNECECFSDVDCAPFNGANKCLGTYKCTAANQCHFDPKTVVKCGAGVCSDPNKFTKETCPDSGGLWTSDTDCAATSCDEKIGKCVQTKLKNGVNCNDGNPCTVPDVCADGQCDTQAKVCDDSNGCTKDSCDPASPAGCVFDHMAMDALPCDDGDVCNAEGGCKGGICKAGVGVKDCNDGNTCTADGCDPQLGCYNLPLAGDACDDGNYCTGWGVGTAVQPPKGQAGHAADHCTKQGSCVPGDKITCDDGGACTQETCVPGGWSADLPGAASKSCAFVYLGQEATCVSSDKCTENDTCNAGTCSGVGTSVSCDDANECTDDSCDPKAGCLHKANEAVCDDGNTCTIEDTCTAKVCFTQKTLGCDDENLCTKDTCDPKGGCKHEVDPAANSCGDFATCSKPPTSKCEFAGSQHLMISEIYVGDPVDPSDDFIEIYNPSQKKPELADYELQWRPKDSAEVGDWQLLIKLPSITLHDYGYLLTGHSGPLPGGIKPDVADAVNFKLDPAGMQVRIFDKPHTLTHDAVTWGEGEGLVSMEGTALKPWFSARSMERKATKDSDASTLARGGAQWLAGNAYDNDNNAGDFIVRLTPDPQGMSLGTIYEPACSGKCSSHQKCDYKGAGKDACVLDANCSVGCGSGKQCQAGGFGLCVPGFKDKVLISEVLMGAKGKPGAQLIELYNAGVTAIDLTGFVFEVKASAAGKPDPWTYVVQLPAKTLLPPKRFYLVATQSWAGLKGGVDLIVKDADLQLDPTGGALRLRDPRAGVELDKLGWGPTKEYDSGAYMQGAVPAGMSLVRKAKPGATSKSMAPGGADHLGGHAVDTDVPNEDFVLSAVPEPWSRRSGGFAPACGGGCSAPAVCNFVGKGACVDPTCGGACKPGSVCDITTGKCDLTVLISQYSVLGPEAKAKQGLGLVDLSQTKNEWVEIFNPGHAEATVAGMVIQVQYVGVSGWKTRTQILSDKCISDQNKTSCAGPQEKCHCETDLARNADGSYQTDAKGNTSPRQCVFDPHCRATVVPPRGYLLIAGTLWDVNLPQPQLWAKQQWGFDPKDGGLRLVRADGTVFPHNKTEADKVGWGKPGTAKWCPTKMPAPDPLKPECTFMRKPWAGATAEQMNDPMHPAYYGGSGHKTDSLDGSPDCQTDWHLICPRRPRNVTYPPQNL